MDLTQEGSNESNSFDSLKTLCKKAIESGRKENVAAKCKRKFLQNCVLLMSWTNGVKDKML
jgi:hypothetical protein